MHNYTVNKEIHKKRIKRRREREREREKRKEILHNKQTPATHPA